MEIVKGIVRTLSIWVFVVVALLGAVVVIYPLPVLGVIIAGLTILALSVQGTESVRAKNELDQRHTSLLQEIDQARQETATKHTEALQEIVEARKETATRHAEALLEIGQARAAAASQHTQAMLEIEQAREEAARQYAEAAQEIKKAGAERLLLQAEKLATSLMEKDELVNEAIALYPDFKQQELKKLGIEMSAAVIGDEDYLKWKSMQVVMGSHKAPMWKIPLEPEERTYFTDHAIQYLTETVFRAADEDAVGLVYLACMYGYCHQYDDMMLALERARQIGPIRQVMKDQWRERPMLFLFLGACGSDQANIERLRETLNLSQPTEQYFCTYVSEEYPLTSAYQRGNYSEWAAFRRPDALRVRDMHSTLIKIALVGDPEDGKTYAFFVLPNGSIEDIVPADKQVPVKDLYGKLSDGFILFCPLDEPYKRLEKQAAKPILRLG